MTRFDDHFLDDIRARVPISQLIGQRVSWDRKKTNASRGDYWAPCPFHGEKNASFHCEDTKGRYHCFGCGVTGGHFKFLTELDGCTFPRAVELIADMAGISIPSSKPLTDEEKREWAQRKAASEKAAHERQQQAEADRKVRSMSAGLIWKQTVPLAGTLGWQYYETRCPGLAPLDSETEIRFHSGLEIDPDKPRGDRFPCIISRVSDVGGKGVAVWRNYLNHDGSHLRDRDGRKMKFGYGPSAGGAVRLGGMAKRIGIAEGVETSLAVRALGETRPVWAGLSTSGIAGFVLPDGVDHVLIYPDPDGSKIKTRYKPDGTSFIGKSPGYEAARRLCERYPDKTAIAPAAFDADFLEVLQKMKGVPIR